MAVEVQQFPVLIPSGTAQATPQVSSLKMPPRVVQEIEFLVPPGPRGEVGFRITSGGQQVLPVNLNSWIVTDNEVIRWPTENLPTSGAFELTAYNTGQFAHTVTVRFLVGLPQVAPTSGTAAIDATTLGAVAGSDAGSGLPPLPPVPPPPPGALPPAPNLIPPIPPVLPGFGEVPAEQVWADRPVQVLTAQYGGRFHVFETDPAGQLHHTSYGATWQRETIDWATGLAPAGGLAGAQFGGLAHVFAFLQAGGILHLAQPDSGGTASSWGGEVLSGS